MMVHAAQHTHAQATLPVLALVLEPGAQLLMSRSVPLADERELWQDLFDVMKDQQRCPLDQVPETGLSTDDEHKMSSMFIDEITIRVRLTTPAACARHVHPRSASLKEVSPQSKICLYRGTYTAPSLRQCCWHHTPAR